MNCIDYALKYYEQGFSVIPIIPRQKKPMIKWQSYQNERATPEQIKKWWTDTPNANVGIVTGKISDLFVIDLDKHDPAYNEETVLQYIPDNIVCPVVNTPKGGQHLYFRYPNEEITIGSRFIPGCDFRGEGGYVVAPPSINGNGKPYEWSNAGASLTQPPRAAIDIIINNKYIIRENEFVKNPKLNNVNNVKDCYFYAEEGQRDDAIFHAANLLLNGKASYEEIYKILYILAKNCNPPFPESEIKAKINSAINRAETKGRNISHEVREWALLNDVNLLLKDCYQELKLVKKEEMLIARVTINAMCKEGILNKDNNIRGKYSLVKPVEDNIIDLTTADNKSLIIKFPLGIHDLVKIMPKNIIVIAGESNAGKTAFLLNTAAKNMIDNEVVYFSSEMGGAELKERLLNFNEKVPFTMWSHCTFIERSNDFDVAIRPNAINIIDFMEIHDEFYKVGGFIKKIFDKLDQGIAIIAIQKNKGREDGLGGQRSIEKARLYLSMSPGVVKIVKAKNWVSGLINPNGMVKNYKLAKGMIFSEQSNWMHDGN